MNETTLTPNGTFTFQCVLRFEIDPDTAASLLAENDPTQSVHAWLLTQHASPEDIPYCGNANDLREQLGKYEADKKVNQARALLPCADVNQLTC